MLDRDLAELYGTQTKVLNQAVKRKRDRFPEDFMFSLTRQEILRMSQFVTSFSRRQSATLKFSKKVTVFTEQGVAMLSSVLNSERAVQVNIAIMRSFVKLREIIATHKDLAHKLAELERRVEKNEIETKGVFDAIRQLMAPPSRPKRRIGFLADREEEK